MKEANIYILNNFSWVKTFPKIMEVAVSKGARIHISCESDAVVREMDDLLWTYEQLSFLPHATDRDPLPEEQPILISAKSSRLNSAEVIALVGKSMPENLQDYKKALILHDPKDSASKEAVLQQIDLLKEKNFNIRYFRQTAGGSWKAANSF